MNRRCVLGLALAMAGLGLTAQAGSPKESFQQKWQKILRQKPDQVFKISAKVGEEIPEATLQLSFGPDSLTSVSRGKSEAPVKDMLGDADISGVVNRNLREIKFCYCSALKADPQFEGEAIVAMKIKNSGEVGDVLIDPQDIASHHFGKCLAPRVARWKFPRFTGKKESGLRLKSISYEFPLAFNRAE